MRILHTADIHAGAFPRSRLRSACVDALNELCELALTEDVEVFVVAGDLFESPRVESHEVLRGVCRALRRLCREGVNVVCVPGSHDLTPGGLGMLTILEELDVVKIPPYEEGGGLLKLKPPNGCADFPGMFRRDSQVSTAGYGCFLRVPRLKRVSPAWQPLNPQLVD